MQEKNFLGLTIHFRTAQLISLDELVDVKYSLSASEKRIARVALLCSAAA